ncbi:hypothetical protein BCR34DRAFT_601114 [Clohesyomyces aquaticus]|uniref:Uncharacterized protein n=1 Tax=Clohesyomyces aquaticus TaxID=1231657 RepID=A0A1Y1ZNK8_9PLEO|nr:hypothetical protein BCR34DRAFT_601114 [Clohesyomyces aquaticus]
MFNFSTVTAALLSCVSSILALHIDAYEHAIASSTAATDFWDPTIWTPDPTPVWVTPETAQTPPAHQPWFGWEGEKEGITANATPPPTPTATAMATDTSTSTSVSELFTTTTYMTPLWENMSVLTTTTRNVSVSRTTTMSASVSYTVATETSVRTTTSVQTTTVFETPTTPSRTILPTSHAAKPTCAALDQTARSVGGYTLIGSYSVVTWGGIDCTLRPLNDAEVCNSLFCLLTAKAAHSAKNL